MKELKTLNIYIDANGAEQLARGDELYNWNFTVADPNKPPPYSIKVGQFRPEYPAAAACAARAVTKLRERQTEIYAQAAQEAAEVGERIKKLEALEWSGNDS